MPQPGEGTVGEDREAVSELADLVGSLPDGLYRQALTHPSWVDERTTSYERLAFLGDSVLGLAVAGEVFERFAEHDSGRLTKILNQSVSATACAEVGGRSAYRSGCARQHLPTPAPGSRSRY